MDAIDPHHHAGLASHISRAPGMARRMPLAYPNLVADGEPGIIDVRTRIDHWLGADWTTQGKPTAGTRLKLGSGHQPVLDRKGGRRREPMLVIARRQVVIRGHPLDRVPEL